MLRVLPMAAVLLLALGLGGCVRYPGGVAPSNIPLDPHGYTELGPVAAEDCNVLLFGLLPVSGGNEVLDALNKAKRRRPDADALIQVTVDRVSKYFILWSQTCTEVRAIAVRRQ